MRLASTRLIRLWSQEVGLYAIVAGVQNGTSVICTWENPRTEVRGNVTINVSECRDAAGAAVETRVNHIVTR